MKLRFRNGMTVDCDVKYIGCRPFPDRSDAVHDGWRVINEGPFDHREGDQLIVGYMPAYSWVEVQGTGSRDGEAAR